MHMKKKSRTRFLIAACSALLLALAVVVATLPAAQGASAATRAWSRVVTGQELYDLINQHGGLDRG